MKAQILEQDILTTIWLEKMFFCCNDFWELILSSAIIFEKTINKIYHFFFILVISLCILGLLVRFCKIGFI